MTAGTVESGAEPATAQPAANPIDGNIFALAGNSPMLRQSAAMLTTTPLTTAPPAKAPLPADTPAILPTQSPVNTALSVMPSNEPLPANVPIDKASPGKASSLPVPVKVALESAPLETAPTDPVPAPVEAQLPNAPVISSKVAATPDQAPAQPRLAATAIPQQENAATPSPATRFTAPPSTPAQSQEARSNSVPPVVTQKTEVPEPPRAITPTAAPPVATLAPAPQQEDFIVSQATPEAFAAPAEPDAQTRSNIAEPAPIANSRPAALSGPAKVSQRAVAARVQSDLIVPVSSQETVRLPAQANDVPAQSPAPAGPAVAPNDRKPEDQAKQFREVPSTRPQSASAAVLTPDVPVPSATTAPGHDDTHNAGQSAPQLPAQSGNATLVGTTPAVPLAPRTENLAFTLQMTHTDALPARAPVPQTKPVAVEPAPVQARQPDSNVIPREPQPSTAPEASQDNRASAYAEVLRKNSAPETGLHWADATPLQHADVRAASISGDTAEPAPAGPASPAPDIQPPLEASPKIPVNQEILLQVGGNNQATASIRVADRAGTVNISVHATDPDLRNSLRSNLGDLSSQLNTQGWRTEVSRPVPAATHAENARDSHSEGERSSSQQQPSGGGRQQNQQRRANAGSWQDEFEEVSSQPASTGGKI